MYSIERVINNLINRAAEMPVSCSSSNLNLIDNHPAAGSESVPIIRDGPRSPCAAPIINNNESPVSEVIPQVASSGGQNRLGLATSGLSADALRKLAASIQETEEQRANRLKRDRLRARRRRAEDAKKHRHFKGSSLKCSIR